VPAHAIPQYLTNQTHSQNAGALEFGLTESALQGLAGAIAAVGFHPRLDLIPCGPRVSGGAGGNGLLASKAH
jgi:hypothetical protein